jgi:apolipoprotein N-acyltransferase
VPAAPAELGVGTAGRRAPPALGWALLSAAGGGVLYCLGYLGHGAWPLLFVFLVPLGPALDRARDDPPALAFLLASLFGFTAYAGGFTWLWRLVPVFLAGRTALGGALWLVYGAWFAAGFGVYGLAYRAIRRRGGSVPLAGVPTLVLLEWVQPQVFAVNAGSGLAPATAWIQIADLGGPLLLTAFVGVANVAAFATWGWMRDGRDRGEVGAPWATWIAVAAVAVLVLVYGRIRIAAVAESVRSAPALRVGVVQANLGVLEKRKQGVITHRAHLEQSRELLAGGDVDVLIWPETAYVRGIRRPLPVSGQTVRGDLAVPLLFGGTSVQEEGGRRVKSNSAFLVGADGMVRDAYDKNLLIPLAEYAPFASVLPALAEALPHVQEFRAADEVAPLHLGPWRIATPICYEAIRPDLVRRMVAESRPHLFVTLANDAWFGDSAEPWMHLALARLRAVEHRRFLVRATNSGVSAVVDPTGRLVARSGLFTRENLRGTVSLLEGETVYARVGDWPAWIAAALVALALLRPAELGRRAQREEPGSRARA